MAQKIKIFLIFAFAALLISACFFIFREKISTPEKMLIKNSDNIAGTADSPPAGGLSAENDAPTNSDNVAQIKNISENKEPIKSTETKKGVASYEFQVTRKLVSWGYSSVSNRKIDTIVIHSSYNALGGDEYSVDKLLVEYKEYGVAPHYLVDREGKIYKLVEEKNIAYHAGKSKTPDGRTGVNNFSIGIEIMTTENEKPTDEQYEALNSLLSTLKSRYSIKYILGHSDIASGRKTDPWNFEWNKVRR